MDLAPGELITKVRLKRPSSDEQGDGFITIAKSETRAAQAISKICLAGFACVQGERISQLLHRSWGVAPIPLRCPKTESVLKVH